MLQKTDRLGAASQELWTRFWIDIQKIVNFLSRKYLNQDGVQINGIANTDLPALMMAVQSNSTRPL
jgi:hypothetical protein